MGGIIALIEYIILAIVDFAIWLFQFIAYMIFGIFGIIYENSVPVTNDFSSAFGIFVVLAFSVYLIKKIAF